MYSYLTLEKQSQLIRKSGSKTEVAAFNGPSVVAFLKEVFTRWM